MKVGSPLLKFDLLKILKGLWSHYEEHHNVTITEEVLKAAGHMSVKYINDRFLPDKTINLINEAFSKVHLGVYYSSKKLYFYRILSLW